MKRQRNLEHFGGMKPGNKMVALLHQHYKNSMEYLFTTSLVADEKNHMYKVYFDKEKYNFLSEVNGERPDSFSFKREHDEWHDVGTIPPQLRTQALQALEEYLLAQH